VALRVFFQVIILAKPPLAMELKGCTNRIWCIRNDAPFRMAATLLNSAKLHGRKEVWVLSARDCHGMEYAEGVALSKPRVGRQEPPNPGVCGKSARQPEGVALVSTFPGGTLSEFVAYWFGYPGFRGKRPRNPGL
jgi:hypothetical protein